MQLKIQRSQRMGGLVGNAVFFCLDVRADYSVEEKHYIQRYRLGGEIVYSNRAARKHQENANAHLARTQSGPTGERAAGLARGMLSVALAKMQLSISIASLARGHHIECKDLEELLEAEDTLRTACKNVTRYLEVASTFDGSELVIEYVNGEEQVHIAQGAPPLLQYRPQLPGTPPAEADAPRGNPFDDGALDWMHKAQAAWLRLEESIVERLAETPWPMNKYAVRAVAAVLGLLLLYFLIRLL